MEKTTEVVKEQPVAENEEINDKGRDDQSTGDDKHTVQLLQLLYLQSQSQMWWTICKKQLH